MTLKLMIRCGLHGGAELMPIDIESFAPGPARNFRSGPRVDRELHENHSFRIEEKQNFVQPVDDLSFLVRPGGLEMTFFVSAKRRRVDQNASRPACKNADVRGVFKQLEVLRICVSAI
jgi:hypothetical protein